MPHYTMKARSQRRFIEEFIEIYKREPCLWKVKSKEYQDRQKKDAAYLKLVKKLQIIDPAANRDSVVMKINNLRSNLRKEKKKIDASIKSGASGEDVYCPKLWYYDLFGFLSDQKIPREFTTKVDTDEETSSEDQNADTLQLEDAQNAENTSLPETHSPSSSPAYTAQANSSRPPKRKPEIQGNENNTQLSETISQADLISSNVSMSLRDHFKRPAIQDDRSDIFGKSVAIKLRDLPKQQRLIAEKIINDVLFEAEMGNLTLSHCLTSAHQDFSIHHSPTSFTPLMRDWDDIKVEI